MADVTVLGLMSDLWSVLLMSLASNTSCYEFDLRVFQCGCSVDYCVWHLTCPPTTCIISRRCSSGLPPVWCYLVSRYLLTGIRKIGQCQPSCRNSSHVPTSHFFWFLCWWKIKCCVEASYIKINVEDRYRRMQQGMLSGLRAAALCLLLCNVITVCGDSMGTSRLAPRHAPADRRGQVAEQKNVLHI